MLFRVGVGGVFGVRWLCCCDLGGEMTGGLGLLCWTWKCLRIWVPQRDE
jgi:hypothetical protein